jgi:hypothetical protein
MKCQSFAAFLSIIWYLKPFTTAFVRISRLRIHSTKPIYMESTNIENSPKSANSEAAQTIVLLTSYLVLRIWILKIKLRKKYLKIPNACLAVQLKQI